jgi:S1-C subfamily serine protease
MPEDLERLKSACARVVGAGSQGTGYVVAPERIVTCHHVVAKWSRDARYEVFLGPRQERRAAWLLDIDPDSDAAVVAFENSVDVEPLPLASSFSRKDAFLG